jgi:histidine phosphotransferase ChpT
LRGETADPDARGVQPVLAYRLARGINAGFTICARDGRVEIAAG